VLEHVIKVHAMPPLWASTMFHILWLSHIPSPVMLQCLVQLAPHTPMVDVELCVVGCTWLPAMYIALVILPWWMWTYVWWGVDDCQPCTVHWFPLGAHLPDPMFYRLCYVMCKPPLVTTPPTQLGIRMALPSLMPSLGNTRTPLSPMHCHGPRLDGPPKHMCAMLFMQVV
jgi:hypothetical protein